MLAGRPVIACNSGGPLETVVNEKTGFLCESNPDIWANKMLLFVNDRLLTFKMRDTCRAHVESKFSNKELETVLNAVLGDTIKQHEKFAEMNSQTRKRITKLQKKTQRQSFFVAALLFLAFVPLAPFLFLLGKL
ncbi:hypothetical protein RFI_16897 [Reticulomyxa filosa]|uniref:Glycosyl transferase family 1 domain-containing protein n=1 Tax=Reticulomyxa filosa TaxID=46433 RepID=X6N224_RETFI|nr:hypothetical protein RFI_16897 [Reticulomyxa filosa]|eukprot:ETO20320.1 hypothetical protein RFI_16897 [Reticulomyxa filosa]